MLQVDREASVLRPHVAQEKGMGRTGFPGLLAWEKAKFLSSPEEKGDIAMEDT